MRGKGAVVGAAGGQPALQKAEMFCFLKANLHPIVEKRPRHLHARESPNQIPCEIDGIQFDMRQ